jgi:carbonic anhydrase/acetyltransferase-like protein (isoleucine patch superfamily)
MAIYKLGEHAPVIHPTAWVAPEATVIGKVTLAEGASVWPGAVLRGDNEPITIGKGSNVQESAILHTDPGCPLIVGEDVTIGHQAMLHGCIVHDGALIGIQAVVLNKAVIGARSLVGAGAVVTEGKEFPGGVLILGAPAKVARELSEDNANRLRMSALSYAKRQVQFRETLVKIG